jgi:hypothetical protein
MLGIEEMGFVIVMWGAGSLLFRDWVVKFDLLMRERISGDYFSERAIEEQRRLLEKTGRIVLAVGVLIFAAGVVLRQMRLA